MRISVREGQEENIYDVVRLADGIFTVSQPQPPLSTQIINFLTDRLLFFTSSETGIGCFGNRLTGGDMRRVMLLTVLALVLPTAALANSIDPVNTGAGKDFQLQIGTLSVGNFTGNGRACLNFPSISCSTSNYFDGHNVNGGTDWVLNLVGPTGRIRFDVTSLTNSTGHNCALNGSSSTGTCNFSGTVTAFGTTIPNPNHMFTDSISGTLTRGPNATCTTFHVP